MPLWNARTRASVSPFAGVRAIAFDLDQTLIDFAASRVAGLLATLARLEGDGHRVPRDAFLKRHAELASQEDDRYLAAGTWRPTEERFRILCEEFSLPADGYAGELARVYVEARYANLRQFPESASVLGRLKGRFPLFLVTNGPSDHQHREIEVTGVAPYFNRIFVCDDFGLRKPDPRVFEMIRSEAGVASREMLIVGDNPEADIDEPRRLGWRTAWIVRDPIARSRAPTKRADVIIGSIAEVPALLG